MTRHGTIIITGTNYKEMAELGHDLKQSIGKLVPIGFHNEWIFNGPGQPATRIITFAVFDDSRLCPLNEELEQ